MEEIRMNKTEEKILLEMRFQIPLILHILAPIAIVLATFLAVFTGISEVWAFVVIVAVIYIVLCIGIHNEKCIITDKKIKGRKFIFFGYKSYNLRLDMIDGVESQNIAGINGIKIKFTQGYVNSTGGDKTLKIENVKNIDEVLAQLNKIISSIRNDKDVAADLSLKQSQAINNIATSIASNKQSVDIVNSLSQLKRLLNEKVISSEEYEKKRKELLEKF